MSSRASPLAAALVALAVAGAPLGAETGDIDGDGRITLADVKAYLQHDLAAPGSVDAFASNPCAAENLEVYNGQTVPLLIYLESLSRAGEGYLPPWFPIWPDKASREPLPADPRVAVLLEDVSAPGGGSDRMELRISLDAVEAIEAFSLVIESDGNVLQPLPSEDQLIFWTFQDGRYLSAAADSSRWVHAETDPRVATPVLASLVAGGNLVINYGIMRRVPSVLGPGRLDIITGVRLPAGTVDGTYRFRLAPGSEVLLADGTLIVPLAAGEGKVTVLSEVAAGWREGPLPLKLDVASRSVLGAVEFRLVDAEGEPAVDGEPLAAARRGEEVVLRVQMRTEVPLNHVHYAVAWPQGTFECGGTDGLANGNGYLFRNPEDDHLYEPFRGNGAGCISLGVGPHHQSGRFYLAGGYQADAYSTYPERLLEFFKPLGEWVDVQEFRLLVSDWAPAGDAVLAFERVSSQVFGEFMPYGARLLCDSKFEGWSYDLRLHPATVRVLAEEPPPPPPPAPDIGLVVSVGDATGQPGEVVEVPVLVHADEAIRHLRVAIVVDTTVLDVERIAVDFVSLRTGETVRRETGRGEGVNLRDCVEEGESWRCYDGVPLGVRFESTGPEAALVEVFSSRTGLIDYPGLDPFEVLRLVVRVREDAVATSGFLRPGTVRYVQAGFEVEAEPSALVLRDDDLVVAPASEVREGRVTVVRDFRRGDPNSDGTRNLTDVVNILDFLFRGGELPTCLQSADLDDNGSVGITDAIVLLGVLFLGQNEVPPPFEACGLDPTPDPLACARPECP